MKKAEAAAADRSAFHSPRAARARELVAFERRENLKGALDDGPRQPASAPPESVTAIGASGYDSCAGR